jgi:phage terminase small subunit
MTPKQLLFVSEYLKHGNATQAYMTAYGIADEDQAAANASRLIRNDKVARALQLHTATIMEQTKITVEDVIRRINHLADHAKDDYAKLKALDMLMKHLGGYEKDNGQKEPTKIIVERHTVRLPDGTNIEL